MLMVLIIQLNFCGKINDTEAIRKKNSVLWFLSDTTIV